MIIKKLKLQNIRSYKNVEIEFSKGATLLAGDIGCGKTSLLLGLQFALFGLQPGQKGTSIMREGEDRASAQLEFEIVGREVIIERELKRGKGISQEKSSITIDGQKEELSTSEMKDKVISLLNYPKEFLTKSNLLYKFTVYTPQEEMKSIIQERPEIRLDTLRHIFGIDRYKRIQENSQIFLQKIKETIKIKEILVGELNLLKEKLNNISETKIKLKKDVNDFGLQIDNLKKVREEKKKGVEELQEHINQEKVIVSRLSNQRTALRGKDEMKRRFEKEIVSMNNQIKEKVDFSPERLVALRELVNRNKENLEQLRYKLIEINSQISGLEAKKEGVLELKEKVISMENCPTCFQSVEKEHKDRITKKTGYDIEEINRYLEPKIFERNKIEEEIERQKGLVREYEKDCSELDKNGVAFKHQKLIETKIKSDSISLSRIVQEIEELNKQIALTEGELSKFVDIDKKFQERKKDFEFFDKEYRGLEISFATKNKELEMLIKQMEELQSEIQSKEKLKDQVVYLRNLQDWIQEKFQPMIIFTEKNVMSKLRGEFSKVFQKWFAILVSDTLSARLDEDFTPIIAQQDYELDYDFLSGGERTAVALAYRLALNQVLNSILSRIRTKGLIILDEPTDGFSEQQLDKIRDIFDELKYEQLILVSHEQKIEGFVDKVIRVRKEGVSRVDAC